MDREKMMRLAALLDANGMCKEAEKMRRVAIDFVPPLYEGGPHKDPVYTPSRLTKMQKKHEAVPEALQDWTEVEQRGKMVPQLRGIERPTYVVDPSVGGEPGFPLPSGARAIGLDIPRTEEGTYSEDPSTWGPSVISPGGEFVPGGEWNEPGDLDALTEQYMERAEDFRGRMTEASQTFNRRMKDWTVPVPGKPTVVQLLAQNFWVNVDRVLYGGARDTLEDDRGEQFSVEALSGSGSRNLMAAIEHRLNAIAQIQSGVESRRAAAGDEVQRQVLDMQTDALASLTGELWHSNPKEYMRNLSLVYGGDADLISINPLGVDYPDELKSMIDAWLQTAASNANIPTTMDEWIQKNTQSAREQGVDPRDMLSQAWPLIDVGPEAMHRATWMRKHIRDVSHFQGFTSPKTEFQQARPTAQLFEVEDYGDEINRLMALQEAVARMVELKSGAGMPDFKMQTMIQNPQIVSAMDDAVDQVLTISGQLYGSDRFVTKDERMNPAYDVGTATKMEIFGKTLFIAQAWNAFKSRFAGLGAGLQGGEPGGGEPRGEGGFGPTSSIGPMGGGFARVAAISDAMGVPQVADEFDRALAAIVSAESI
jgi:hypothetical protein